MASLDGGYDPNDAPSTGFEPLPVGDYLACISASERKPTKAGTGHFLALVFEILDGQYKGRKLFVNLNLWHPSDEATAIARAEWASIRKATGIMAPKDSEELHNLPICLSLGRKKRADTGDIENKIKAYKPRGEYKPSINPAKITPSANGKPVGPAPWVKK